MKQSLRAKRMARNHRRLKRGATLNLVALMDVFTILVFFLLVNSSSDVHILQQDGAIELPASMADTLPNETLVVAVSAEDILVSGRRVATVREVLAADDDEIASLAEELKFRASRERPLNEAEQEVGRPVTIMGDHSIPYSLLKKIMATCAATDYRDISLAVNRREEGG